LREEFSEGYPPWRISFQENKSGDIKEEHEEENIGTARLLRAFVLKYLFT